MPEPTQGPPSPDAPLRALIVEDEPLGYRRLVDVLTQHPDVEVVGWARTTKAARAAIQKHRPNVLFLDIHMPGISGLDLARSLATQEHPPMIVFVTAHDRYAVSAFELDAVDYLLKPYVNERVEEALDRLRSALATRALMNLTSRLNRARPAISPPRSESDRARSPYLSRIAVESRGRLRVIPVEQIDRIRASGVYAELHTTEGRFLLRESLTGLDLKLDPQRFCRIHRSEIVALDSIESYSRGGGQYAVHLKSGLTLPVGRSYRKELERRLGRL
jgi:two-component system LytT family response regulator